MKLKAKAQPPMHEKRLRFLTLRLSSRRAWLSRLEVRSDLVARECLHDLAAVIAASCPASTACGGSSRHERIFLAVEEADIPRATVCCPLRKDWVDR